MASQARRSGLSRPMAALAAFVIAISASVLNPISASAQLSAEGSSQGSTGRPLPEQDPFYSPGPNLAQVKPGAPIRQRDTSIHFLGIPTPLSATQVLYRSNDSLGKPTATATTVIRPAAPAAGKVVSFQSAYDSLSPECQPSYVFAGGLDRGAIVSVETPLITAYLLRGYTVIMSDFEGQKANFAAGREYGQATLDGIRAAALAQNTGVTDKQPVVLAGYSGGGIATQWAAELAPKYAPDVNSRLAGATMGGMLANPINNLNYIDGTLLWKGVLPMALVGLARGYGVDFNPYLSDFGKKVFAGTQRQCILDGFGETLLKYPNMTFAQLVKPEYADPKSIPELVKVANNLVMGTGGTPTIPLQVRQATNGVLEGSPGNKPGIGPGDGVMIRDDVRALYRGLCGRGVAVDYAEYTLLSHVPGIFAWYGQSLGWIDSRFAGAQPVSTCSALELGTPLVVGSSGSEAGSLGSTGSAGSGGSSGSEGSATVPFGSADSAGSTGSVGSMGS